MENSKRMSFFGIRGKLVSAVCMLLVAVIMVVSSTYAWFTLSTAPEVSGISTSIGSNGSLEIKLNDGTATGNGTYGNLVDLSSGYGLDQITLLPSMLGTVTDGKLTLSTLLAYPSYGNDGRVTGTGSSGLMLGTYTDSRFLESKNFGVRAVGTSSGKTNLQLAWRNAKSAATTAVSSAKNSAVSSLSNNGNTLASIVVQKATNSNSNYTKEQVEALGAMLVSLDAAADSLEEAYKQMTIAWIATQAGNVTGQSNDGQYTIFTTAKGAVDADWSTIKTNGTITINGTSVDLPETIKNGLTDLADIQSAIDEANVKYNALDSEATSYSWDDIGGIVNAIFDTDGATVNGFTAEQLNAEGGKDAFVNDYTANPRMVVAIKNGEGVNGGVYADIADQCGEFTANVTVYDISYGGLTLKELAAQMTATNYEAPTFTDSAKAVMGTEPTKAGAVAGETSKTAMTEFYGYIIDLTFRTNAANSNLLLQTEAKDRIYEDNKNADTQGSGSYMTFKSSSTDFTDAQVKNLMRNIRIVFFETGDANSTEVKVLAYAMLDVDNATVTVDEEGDTAVTAKMYLYENVLTKAYTVTDESGNSTTTYYYFTTDGNATTYYTDAEHTKALDTTTDATLIAALDKVEAGYRAYTGTDAVITALGQNSEVNVSALVYLDGETIENGDVSATSSVTGKMNLQFSSDATLTPMEYAGLHQKAQQTTTNTESETSEPSGN